MFDFIVEVNLFLFPEQYHRHVVHLPADGSVYYTDTSVPHTFLNGGTKDRYHIVLSSTLDQLIQPGSIEKVDGFIGRMDAKAYKASDNYVTEISADRKNYQLGYNNKTITR